MSLLALCAAAYAALLVAAAVCDVAWLKVPNAIPVALLVLLGIAGAASPQPIFWLSHASAGAVILAFCVPLYALGKIGGGDVKLMSILGLWQGFPMLPTLLFAVAICGCAVAVTFLVLRALNARSWLASIGIRLVSLEAADNVPYAVAISGGALTILPHVPVLSPLFT